MTQKSHDHIHIQSQQLQNILDRRQSPKSVKSDIESPLPVGDRPSRRGSEQAGQGAKQSKVSDYICVANVDTVKGLKLGER